MPFLATFLAPLLRFVFDFALNRLSQKIWVFAALAGVFSVLTLTFYLAVKALVVGVTYTITNQYTLMIFYSIWPSNAETCITAIFACDIAAWTYKYSRDLLKLYAG